jgi:membrane protein
MPSFKDRLSAKVDRFRGRHRKVEHVFRMVSHYGDVNGNAQAGAVTFFGFLSVFPILALAFFAVGVLAQIYPDLRVDIGKEIENLLPGVVGSDKGEIPLKTFSDYAATLGVIGVLGLMYAGLGWLSGMRVALETMFVLPKGEHPNFVVGKLRDLGTLVLLGTVLLVSVALSGLVASFSEQLLAWFDVDTDAVVPNSTLWLLSHGLAIAASTVLLVALFRLLAHPHVPRRSLLDGALLGAIGFELLKAAAYFLIELTKGNPAFQVFGVSLILLIWINYFSRLVMYAASYAYTSPAAVDLRAAEAMRAPAAPFADAAVAEEATAAEVTAEESSTEDASVVEEAAVEPATPIGVADPTAGDRRSRTLAVAAGSALAGAGVAAFVARRRGRIER